NLLFYGIFCDKLIDKDIAGLSDAVCPVNRLLFYGRVPPRIKNEYVVSLNKVEADTSCLDRDQEQPGILVLTELLHHLVSVLCGAIQICVSDIVLIKILLENYQLLHKL